jgi:hypothetical protein
MRRLLDRPPGLVGPQPPRHRAGESELRLLAEADPVNTSHISRALHLLRNLTVPTLLDFWMTCAPSAGRADVRRG